MDVVSLIKSPKSNKDRYDDNLMIYYKTDQEKVLVEELIVKGHSITESRAYNMTETDVSS